MPDYSVRILSTNKGVQFDQLTAAPGGVVSWNNTTGETHQITLGTFSTQPILAGRSSRPDFVLSTSATGTLTYYCTLHEGESGTITIAQVVPMPPEEET